MFRLILRQIGKHWRALVPIVVIWLLATYYVFPRRHQFTAALSHALVSLPKPGTQQPEQAYRYVQKARERLSGDQVGFFCKLFDTEDCQAERRTATVRLDLMEKACRLFPPRTGGDLSLYRPHWLETRARWNLTPDDPAPSSAALVEPGPYWKKNRGAVLLALKDLLDASLYAYEISGAERGEPKEATLLVPELFEAHAKALCLDILGSLMWGDYVAFQHDRARAKLIGEKRYDEQRLLYPRERQLAELAVLRGEVQYSLALRRYLGASPPPMGDPVGCKRQVFRLACAAPEEAAEAYKNLLLALPLDQLHNTRLRLGLLYFLQGRRGQPEFFERAITQLQAATVSRATAPDARKNLIRLYLHLKQDENAYAELRNLFLSGMRDTEFRVLARAVLMRMGRHKDADCFANEAAGLFGPRPHCAGVQL